MRIETTVLRHLIHDEDFARKALPFVSDKYFSDATERLIYSRIAQFMERYNSLPSREALSIEIEGSKNLGEKEYQAAVEVIQGLTAPDPVDKAWLLDATEKDRPLAITKLDGTAKGGVVIGISDQFKIPVKYIGVGEGIDDLQVFNKIEFVDSFFK